ncbi:chromosome segregation in meiosis-related protein [Saitoella coloradoensis]
MASSTQLNDLFDEDHDAVHFASTAPAHRSPVFDDVEFDEPLDSYDVVRPASRPVLRDDDLPPEIDTDLRIPANALNDSTAAFSSHHRSGGEGLGLGLDEEVVIKARKERVKLNEERLLGPMGLPKLRKDAPTKLKFKGKGHEFRDLSNLLNFYQLWAHGVYPKASFRDFLTMTEKLGHSKRMRVVRAEWIETERRKDTAQEEEKLEELNPFAPGTKAETQPPFDAADGFPSDDEGLEPMEVNVLADSAPVKLETSFLQDDDEDALAAMADFDNELPW